MARIPHILLMCLVPTLIFSQDQTDSPEELFRHANALYQGGEFTEAVNAYEALIARGYRSAEIHFNLGNAYYREGRIGLAILNYERAYRLDQGDDDIEHNLRLVNLRTADRIESVPELFIVSWLRSLAGFVSLSTTSTVAALSWSFFFLSLATVNLVARRKVQRIARWIILASLIVFILAGVLVALQIIDSRTQNEGIVLAAVVTAKNSPDEASSDAFVIHEGLKVTMGDRIDQWVRITLADGKVGWISSTLLEKI